MLINLQKKIRTKNKSTKENSPEKPEKASKNSENTLKFQKKTKKYFADFRIGLFIAAISIERNDEKFVLTESW